VAGERGRLRRREGDVVSIPLGDGMRGYARVLAGQTLVAFYDLAQREDEDVDVDQIAQAEEAFRICVDDMPFRGRWTRVGSIPLTDAERDAVQRFFKQDPLTGELTIYWERPATGEWGEMPATLADIAGLECAAVWSAEHAEERLLDHLAGRPSRWVDDLKPRPNNPAEGDQIG